MNPDPPSFLLTSFTIAGPFFVLVCWLSFVYVQRRNNRIQQNAARERFMREYGYNLDLLRRANPLLISHIHKLAARAGVEATVSYVRGTVPLPEDIATTLVYTELAAPSTAPGLMQ